MPASILRSRPRLALSAQPRWIAFSIDGRFAYSSTGDIVDAAARKIIGALEDAAVRRSRANSSSRSILSMVSPFDEVA